MRFVIRNDVRNLARRRCLAMGLVLMPLALWAGDLPVSDPSLKLLRDASLMLLKEGNHRFATGKAQHPNLDAERRTNTVVNGQEPFATVLACSDSREPVELIFDRGVGDLFVVRVAGNVAASSELASVEYGVDHLRTPLLVVMGHTRCGAVTAVVKGAELHGHLHQLAEKIRPAITKALSNTNNADAAVTEAIHANVWQTIANIVTESSAVRARVKSGHAQILGAIYDLETGRINWIGLPSDFEALLAMTAQTDANEPAQSTPEPEKTIRPSHDSDTVLKALSRPSSATSPKH